MVAIPMTHHILETKQAMTVEEDGEAVVASENELWAYHFSLTVERKLSLLVVENNAQMVKTTMQTVWMVHILHSDLAIWPAWSFWLLRHIHNPLLQE